MALTSKPKSRLLVRRVQSLALVGGLALTGCTSSSDPADGGVDPGPDAPTMDGFAAPDTSTPNDGGFPDDLGTDDVGIPPMPPPADGGPRLDVGIAVRDGGTSTFDGGLPPMPPPRDGGVGPRIDVGP